MSLFFGLVVGGGTFLGALRRVHVGFAAVAVGAAQVDCAGGVHRGRVGLAMAGDAAGAFASDVGVGLAEERTWGLGQEEARGGGEQQEDNCEIQPCVHMSVNAARSSACATTTTKIRSGSGHLGRGRATCDWWRCRGSPGTARTYLRRQ